MLSRCTCVIVRLGCLPHFLQTWLVVRCVVWIPRCIANRPFTCRVATVWNGRRKDGLGGKVEMKARTQRAREKHVYLQLLDREWKPSKRKKLYSSVPKRLRLPAAQLARSDPMWIQSVLLGFTRDGQHLLTYSTRTLSTRLQNRHARNEAMSNSRSTNRNLAVQLGERHTPSPPTGTVQSQHEVQPVESSKYELQIWSLRFHRTEAWRIFQVPLFRALSQLANENPGPLWETGDERLRITTCETPCKRLFLVHAREDGNCDRTKEGTHHMTIVPSPLVWDQHTIPTHALHLCYHTTTPHPPFHPALCFLPPRWLMINTGTGLHIVCIGICKNPQKGAMQPFEEGPCCKHLDTVVTEIEQVDPDDIQALEGLADDPSSCSCSKKCRGTSYVRPSIRCVQHFDTETFVCNKVAAQTSTGYRLSDYELLPVFLLPSSNTVQCSCDGDPDQWTKDLPLLPSEGTSVLLLAALLTPTERLKQCSQINGNKHPPTRAIALLVALTIPSCESEVLRTVELPCPGNGSGQSSRETQWSSSSLRAAARQHASLLRRRYSTPRSNSSLPFTLSNANLLDTGQSLTAVFNHVFPECIVGYGTCP